MATEKSPRRKNHSGFMLNNQILLILVGVLSAVLVVLLVISGSLIDHDTTDPGSEGMNSVGTQESSSALPDSTGSTGTTTQPSSTPATTPPVPPSGGNYVEAGSGYIAEVIQVNVETFDGDTYDDYSHPTNNYLPEGTVDYCKEDIIYGSGMKYVLLRSGHRVYYDKKVYPFDHGISKMIPEVKQYEGWLPDHNEIGVVSLETVGRHSVLTLDSMWKAPFYFETNQSGYSNPEGGKDRNYAVESSNVTYIDITFCYATVFTGKVTVPANHPLFKSAEIIKNESDYTLRLHLRKVGALYGWHAYYNENDQLCFQFLNPAKASAADNKYGADLSGTTVMIDVGHGGVDGGAVAQDAQGTEWDEAHLNLMLANALKAELESVGATVILNRSDDSALNVNVRQEQFLEISPDICIAIHQNANDDESVRGYFGYYYTPWSQSLAKNIYDYTKASGVYNRNFLQWKANYFMCRQTVCPTVLTENGFMSNAEDLAAMIDPVALQNKATAIAQGIADYFLDINK